jgi:hypothetical protein
MPANSRAPNNKHDDCPNGRTDQTSTLARTVPSESLTQKSRYECAYDAQQSCQDKATWLVISGMMSFASTPATKPIRIVHKIPTPSLLRISLAFEGEMSVTNAWSGLTKK